MLSSLTVGVLLVMFTSCPTSLESVSCITRRGARASMPMSHARARLVMRVPTGGAGNGDLYASIPHYRTFAAALPTIK